MPHLEVLKRNCINAFLVKCNNFNRSEASTCQNNPLVIRKTQDWLMIELGKLLVVSIEVHPHLQNQHYTRQHIQLDLNELWKYLDRLIFTLGNASMLEKSSICSSITTLELRYLDVELVYKGWNDFMETLWGCKLFFIYFHECSRKALFSPCI